MFNYLKQDKLFYRGVISLALPLVFQNLIMTSLAMVDTFMVGLLGEAPMAALTVANTPIFVIQLLIFGLQSGSNVLISQYWGKQDLNSINRVIGIGFYFAAVISSIFAFIMFFFPIQAMSLFSNDPVVIELAAKYVRIAAISYVFNSITGIYIGAHRSIENPSLGLIIFSISMVINTILNYILIFGHFGAPALGVEGAAIATLISRIVEFIIMVFYAVFTKRFKILPKICFTPTADIFRKFIKYSSPVVINETFWGLGTAIYPTIMGHMDNSTPILAAYTIAGNFEKICTVAVFAVAASATTIVGKEIGKGNKDKLYDKSKTLMTLAFGVGFITGIVMLVALPLVIEPFVYPIFNLGVASSQIATIMLTAIFAFLGLRALSTTLVVGILRGGGDVRFATYMDLLPLWFFSLPLAFLVGIVLKWHIVCIYLIMGFEYIVKVIMGITRFKGRKWINDITQTSLEN